MISWNRNVLKNQDSLVRIFCSKSLETGMAVLAEGIILTAAENPPLPEERVETADGKQHRLLPLLSFPRYGISFLKIPRHLPTVRLPIRAPLQRGEAVFFMGIPQGLTGELRRAQIINPALRIVSGGYDRRMFGLKWIQTDVAINPGVPGGLLLNSRGQVIGINTRASRQLFLPFTTFLPLVNFLSSYMNPQRVLKQAVCLICGALSPQEEYYCLTCGAKIESDRLRKELLYQARIRQEGQSL